MDEYTLVADLIIPAQAWIASAIGAAASLAGGMMRNRSQEKAADRQMDFQERLSNTGYQRATKDMRAAGINPILAGRYGPASTPVGAQPILQDAISPAVNAYNQSSQTQSNVGLQKEQAKAVKQSEYASYLANQITELKDLPTARADFLRKRIKASVVEHVEGLVRAASGS